MMLRKFVSFESNINCFFKRFAFTKANESIKKDSKQLLLKLRNKSGYPLISCKEALNATNYDVEKAEEYLLKIARDKGWKKMKDISPNQLNQGLIGVAKNQRLAAIVEINCVTDFVAKTKDFQNLVKDAADIALHNFATDTKMSIPSENILDSSIQGKDQKFSDKMALAIGKLKEQVFLRRAYLLSAPPGGAIGLYIHPSSLVNASRADSTMGAYVALAAISCNNAERSPTYIKQRGRDICQHIVGMKPLTIGEPDLMNTEPNESTVNSETESSEESPEVQEFSPPINNSRELLKQPFLLESEISVEQWLDMSDMKVHDFIRFQVGNYAE